MFPPRPILASVLAVGLLAGCEAPRGPVSINSDDPDLKVQAIKRAGDRRDEDHLPELVRDLDDADPAIRFYASAALRRVTGDAFGYHYYDDEEARKPAVARWRAWLAAQGVARAAGH